MKIEANAKINLALDVCGKRPDGYHEVRMVMQSLDLSDEITLSKRDDGKIRMTMTPVSEDIPTDERNLMVRAARLVKEHCRLSEGVDMHLVKRIPAQAGLAGGSTDAAAVIRGMNRLFELGLSSEELLALGVKIGADVPFCIMGGTFLAEGIGEKLKGLEPAPAFDGMNVLLVKPREGVSTAAMYAAIDQLADPVHPDVDGCIEALKSGDVSGIGNYTSNTFTEVVEKEIPLIRRIREDMLLYGAVASCMSGSGPTVFGLFEREDALYMATDEILKSPYRNKLSDIIETGFGKRNTDIS